MVRAIDALVDLERALARAPDDESLLAVYGDALIDVGDPRGEIIALEQRVGELEASAGAAARRRIRELTREALGAELGPAVRLVGGFLDVLLDPDLPSDVTAEAVAEHVLSDPARRILRRLYVASVGSAADRVLALLARTPLPNLTTLTLALGPLEARAPLELAALAPALQRLELVERAPVIAAGHPTLETLAITGGAAGAWASDDATLPAVTTLVLAVPRDELARRLAAASPVRFPALHTLDLARQRLRIDALDAVARLPIAAQLRTLVLPSVGSEGEAHLLNRSLAAFAGLREIRIPFAYTEHGALVRHATARVVVGARAAWREPSTIGATELLAIDIPGAPFAGHVELRGMAQLLESPGLSDAAARGWRTFWTLVEQLPSAPRGHGPRAPFPAAVLAHAIDALDPRAVARLRGWSALRAALGPTAPRRLTVVISHFRA